MNRIAQAFNKDNISIYYREVYVIFNDLSKALERYKSSIKKLAGL